MITKEKYSIVMPIIKQSYLLDNESRTLAHDNFQRFILIGLPSLLKYINWDEVHTFFIIVRKKEADEFASLISKTAASKLPIVIIHEEILVPYIPKNSKYRVQMLAKIAIATYMLTPIYLIIDDDVVALKDFHYKDIWVSKNKIRYTYDPVFHEDWWKASANILHMEWNNDLVKQLNARISVTPEIFSTKEAIHLLHELQSTYGPSMKKLMITKERWTEYTLMWLYLIQTHKLHTIYKKGKYPLSYGKTNIWFETPNLKEKIQDMFDNKKQWFGVIQSNVSLHTVDTIEKLVLKVID